MVRANLVVIDVGEAGDAADLHLRLMTALGFPEWYGRNWDAFWDSITSLIDMPLHLRLQGWTALEMRLPRDAKLMKKCLDDMQAEYPEAASAVEYA